MCFLSSLICILSCNAVKFPRIQPPDLLSAPHFSCADEKWYWGFFISLNVFSGSAIAVYLILVRSISLEPDFVDTLRSLERQWPLDVVQTLEPVCTVVRGLPFYWSYVIDCMECEESLPDRLPPGKSWMSSSSSSTQFLSNVMIMHGSFYSIGSIAYFIAVWSCAIYFLSFGMQLKLTPIIR